MNLKELHNPTFRQEDNRLYLVGNTELCPTISDNAILNFKQDSKYEDWLQSEVKYPVRDSDSEEIILFLSNIFRSDHKYAPYSYSDFTKSLPKGIPVTPELMEMLELLNTDLFHDGNYPNFCSQCKVAFTGHKRQSVCKKCCDSKIIVTLKEEPKGESQDEPCHVVYVTQWGNFKTEPFITIPAGKYKLVKVK